MKSMSASSSLRPSRDLPDTFLVRTTVQPAALSIASCTVVSCEPELTRAYPIRWVPLVDVVFAVAPCGARFDDFNVMAVPGQRFT
jgi:hypothetical protein